MFTRSDSSKGGLYLLDTTLVDENVTPDHVRRALEQEQLGSALDLSLRLQDMNLIRRTLQHPLTLDQAQFICRQLSRELQLRLSRVLVVALDSGTPHLAWYLGLIKALLVAMKPEEKSAEFAGMEWSSALNALRAAVRRRKDQISELTQFNKSTLDYLSNLSLIYRNKGGKESLAVK